MTEPDRPVDDERPDLGASPTELDLEAPEADAVEQAITVGGAEEDATVPTELSTEANEADVVEQRREVLPDEDDYR